MPKIIKIPYKEAKDLLQEGDLLLFSGKGFISSLIKMAGQGQYSHVAIVSRHNGRWETVEIREWFGGRTIDLQNYLKECIKSKTQIDVYRSCYIFTTIKFENSTDSFSLTQVDFDGKKVTECMRELTGTPYGYYRLWIILKLKLFKWKILSDKNITKDLPTDEIVYPICSSAISHCFNKNGYSLLKNKCDDFIEPSDLALSARLNYIFSLDI